MSSPETSAANSGDSKKNQDLSSDIERTEHQEKTRSVQGRNAASTTDVIASELVRPTPDFLKLIKETGAENDALTKKEIGFYLKEYIRRHVLYDLDDPRIVYCKGDRLGSVFGVDRFTLGDVWDLIEKYTSPLKPYPRWKHPQSASCQLQNRQLHYQAQQQHTPAKATRVRRVSHTITLSSDSRDPVTSSATTGTKRSYARGSAVSDSELHPPKRTGTPGRHHFTGRITPELSISIQKALEQRKRKRRNRSGKHRSSESTDLDGGTKSEQEQNPLSRRRQSSFNIVYANREGATPESQPWFFTVQVDTSDESEALSVQSKETVFVKDSSDDLWFIDTGDDDISLELEIGDDTLSLEIQSNFSEEYEVQSLLSESVNENSSSTSDSGEEVLVVCNDSDIEFWADSSDLETDEEELNDDNLIHGDVWQCHNCDLQNSPLLRHCERCWDIQPGWLPEREPRGQHRRRTYRRCLSAPEQLEKNSPKRNIRPDSTSSDPDNTPKEVKRRKRNSRSSPVVETWSSVTATVQTCAITPWCSNVHKSHKENIFPGNINVSSCSLVPSTLPKPIISMAPSQIDGRSFNSRTNGLNISSDSIEETLSHLPIPKVCMPVNGMDSPVSGYKKPGHPPEENVTVATDPSLGNIHAKHKVETVTAAGQEADILGVKLRDEWKDLRHEENETLPPPKVNHPIFGANSPFNSNELQLIDLSPIQNGVQCASDSTSLMMPLPLSSPNIVEPWLPAVSALPSPRVCMPAPGSNISPYRSIHEDATKPRLSRDDSGFGESNHSLEVFRLNTLNRCQKKAGSPNGSTDQTLMIRADSGLADTTENTDKMIDKPCDQLTSSGTSDLNYTQTSGELSKLSGEGSTLLSMKDHADLYKETVPSKEKHEVNDCSKSLFMEPQTNAEEQVKHRTAGKVGYTDECMICLTGPKEASLIHGKLGHQVCCYNCAKKLYKRGKSCPVCRRPIQKVIRNFIM